MTHHVTLVLFGMKTSGGDSRKLNFWLLEGRHVSSPWSVPSLASLTQGQGLEVPLFRGQQSYLSVEVVDLASIFLSTFCPPVSNVVSSTHSKSSVHCQYQCKCHWLWL